MEAKNKRQQVIIKLCCVIASFVLWLYIFNVENPIKEREISVPVQVVNKNVITQSNLVPIDEENLNINLTIRGNASDIYSIKPQNFKLVSDLSDYVVKKGENKIPVEIKSSPSNVIVTNNENLWVKIMLDDLKRKTVPIKVVFDGKVKEGYYAFQSSMKIKEAEISGPKEEVETVKYLAAICNVKDASKDIETNVSLQPENSSGVVIKNVTINPNSVHITVPIKKVKSVAVNVKTQIPENNTGNVKALTPLQDKIDIAGDESVISNINSLDTEYLDLNNVYGKDVVEVKVVVPKGVTLVNSSGTIKLKVNLDKQIQKEFKLDIQTKNAPNNYDVSLNLNKITIVLSGTENIINNLNVQDMQCFVDLSSLQEGESSVPINVTLPDGVTKVSQSASETKVNIKKKTMEGKNVN